MWLSTNCIVRPCQYTYLIKTYQYPSVFFPTVCGDPKHAFTLLFTQENRNRCGKTYQFKQTTWYGLKLVVITKHNLILMGINLCLSVECEMLRYLEVRTMSTPNAFTNDWSDLICSVWSFRSADEHVPIYSYKYLLYYLRRIREIKAALFAQSIQC